MHVKAFRSVRLVIGLGLCWSTVQAGTIPIKFSDLEDFSQVRSPRARIIDQQFERTLADRAEQLQWSNPELAYVREDVDLLDEYQITLGKRFEVPWAYLKKRSSWKDRITSAELQKAQSTLEHLAELKSGYVRIQLYGEYLIRLGLLKGILTDASHVATTRHTEGHLSGVEDHLVQMTVISLEARHQLAQQLSRETASVWRSAIGLEATDSVSLVTAITYKPVQLESAEHYAGLIESQPGFQAQALLREALSKRAAAERGRFIPSINLYGGYKKIEPKFEGYVAGVSLSLPLFNFNGAAARKYEIESRIVEEETRMNRSNAAGQVRALVQSIAESRLALATVADHFDEDLESFSGLFYSYEEGWMTLNELLNGIQIELNGLKDYYDQLIRYFENLFELEALTGKSLLHFAE